jgi:hypothetical protein
MRMSRITPQRRSKRAAIRVLTERPDPYPAGFFPTERLCIGGLGASTVDVAAAAPAEPLTA